MRFLEGILGGAPIWVWPLLVLLIWVGLRAAKDRETGVAIYYAMPFLAVLTLNGMSQLASPTLAWPVFGCAYAAGVWAGDRFQRGLIRWKSGGRVAVRGEWMTLLAVMGVYWLSFVRGAVMAVAPELTEGAAYVAIVALISGALSGQFAGRAIRVIRTPDHPRDGAA